MFGLVCGDLCLASVVGYGGCELGWFVVVVCLACLIVFVLCDFVVLGFVFCV